MTGDRSPSSESGNQGKKKNKLSKFSSRRERE